MTRGTRIGVFAVVLALLAAACTPPPPSLVITVLAAWTGAEEDAFHAIRKRFEDEYHRDVVIHYQGTRALDQVLKADVQKGDPPDIAIVPSPGELRQYLDQERIYEPDGLPVQSAEQRWAELQTLGRKKPIAVIAKADLKSLVWHSGPSTGEPVGTWEELQARPGRWCLGLAAPPVSGWPGTDWIEDIFLQQAGAANYVKWARGDLDWTSTEMKRAWQTFGEILADSARTNDVPAAGLLTDFGDAGRGMFANPQQCALDHQGSFIQGRYLAYPERPKPGQDFGFFPFPRFNQVRQPSIVTADLAVLFKQPKTGEAARSATSPDEEAPSEEALAFMNFLAGPKAQQVWAERKIVGSSAYSVHGDVKPADYPDPVSQEIARTLLKPGERFCVDASDLMPLTLRNSFYRGVLEFARDPGRLDKILGGLEKVKNAAKQQTPDGVFWNEQFPCG